MNEKIKLIETELKEEIKNLKCNSWNKVSKLFVEMIESVGNTNVKRDIRKNHFYVTGTSIFGKKRYRELFLKKEQNKIDNFDLSFFYKTMLYDKHPKTGKPYQYGTAWLKRVLPDNFENDLNILLDELEKRSIKN